MRKTLVVAAMVMLLTSAVWAQPTCNDMHVVGVEAVDPTGTAQGIFDKLLGDTICVQFDLIEIGVGGAVVDIYAEIENSDGIPVETCCLDDVALPGVNTPFVFGPSVPPADFVFTCCYALQLADPVGSYTITVVVMDATGSCVTPCVPGSWNQTEVEVTGVVPVELTSFEAVAQGNEVNVRWETSSEKENLGFYVLRSTSLDGDYVRASDLVEAQGTSSSGASYSFTDTEVSNGVYFYSLEDVAADGSTTIHDPARVVIGSVGSWGSIKAEFDH